MFTHDMTAEAAIFLATTSFHLCKTQGHASCIPHHTSHNTHRTPLVPRPTSHLTHHTSHLHPRHSLPAISCSFAAARLCSSYLTQRLGSTPPLPAKATAAAAADDVADAAAADPVQSYHTLHITHHTSHITQHTSHITHHTSHITHHTLHITNRTSHITHHTLHATQHTSHITKHTSHITSSTPPPYTCDSMLLCS
jgi:hypothetical protein